MRLAESIMDHFDFVTLWLDDYRPKIKLNIVRIIQCLNVMLIIEIQIEQILSLTP